MTEGEVVRHNVLEDTGMAEKNRPNPTSMSARQPAEHYKLGLSGGSFLLTRTVTMDKLLKWSLDAQAKAEQGSTDIKQPVSECCFIKQQIAW